MATKSNRQSWTPVLILLVAVPTAVYFTMPENSPKFWAFVSVMKEQYEKYGPKPESPKTPSQADNRTSKIALLHEPTLPEKNANAYTQEESPENTSKTTPPAETPPAETPPIIETAPPTETHPPSGKTSNWNDTHDPPATSTRTETPREDESKKQTPKLVRKKKGKPVEFVKRTVKGIPLYETIIDLEDPDAYITIGLANNAERANDQYETHGDEAFEAMVRRSKGAVVMNGTFFSKDSQKRVMGNIVTEGHFRKFSPTEELGTTLGIKAGNVPEMVTARVEAKPNWQEHWFSLTCGPRLLKEGEVWVYPLIEGFSDDHVWAIGPRNAIGYSKNGKKLYLVSFLRGVSLEKAGELMRAIGCYEAMNLDGGASRALSHNGSVIIKASRPLTNVLVVYDSEHKAPKSTVDSWVAFQDGARENP